LSDTENNNGEETKPKRAPPKRWTPRDLANRRSQQEVPIGGEFENSSIGIQQFFTYLVDGLPIIGFYLLIHKFFITGVDLAPSIHLVPAGGGIIFSIVLQSISYQIYGVTIGQWILYQRAIPLDEEVKKLTRQEAGFRILIFHLFFPIFPIVIALALLDSNHFTLIDKFSGTRVSQIKHQQELIYPKVKTAGILVAFNGIVLFALLFSGLFNGITTYEKFLEKIDSFTSSNKIFALVGISQKDSNLGADSDSGRVQRNGRNSRKAGFNYKIFTREARKGPRDWNHKSYRIFKRAFKIYRLMGPKTRKNVMIYFAEINRKHLLSTKSNGHYLKWIEMLGKFSHPNSIKLLSYWVVRREFGPAALKRINHLIQVDRRGVAYVQNSRGEAGRPLLKRKNYRAWITEGRKLEKKVYLQLRKRNLPFQLKLGLQRVQLSLREFFLSGNLRPRYSISR